MSDASKKARNYTTWSDVYNLSDPVTWPGYRVEYTYTIRTVRRTKEHTWGRYAVTCTALVRPRDGRQTYELAYTAYAEHSRKVAMAEAFMAALRGVSEQVRGKESAASAQTLRLPFEE